MKVTIYHNPRCSTSRKVLAAIEDKGHKPEIIEYLKTPPSRAELKSLIKKMGKTPAEAVRKKESLFQELKLAGADDEKLLDAMAKHPILIERPIVVTDKGARLGRPPEAVNEVL